MNHLRMEEEPRAHTLPAVPWVWTDSGHQDGWCTLLIVTAHSCYSQGWIGTPSQKVAGGGNDQCHQESLELESILSGQIPGYSGFLLMVVCDEGREKGILSGCPGRVVPVLGVLGEEQRAEHGCGVWQEKQGNSVCLLRVSVFIDTYLHTGQPLAFHMCTEAIV